MPSDATIIKESFALIEPDAEKATAYFHGRLFAEHPRLRALFPPAMDGQRDRLLEALVRIVWNLDRPEALGGYLHRLGRDHRRLGLRPEHYAAVGTALIATLRRFGGSGWTPRIEAAWTSAYSAAAAAMIDAAEADAAHAPPWWAAEVVAHDRRRHDLAVVTVRPDQPLTFTAGQYVTVQTARWPRVWRPYSVANAPRPDGTLTLHVRAVPAGWVSGTLVRYTAVGDTLTLGPAQGAMTLDPASDRALLLIAGGTGLAPLKALLEQAVAEDDERPVHLVWSVRTAHDLYDLPGLRAIEARRPGLRVTPVISDEPAGEGEEGERGGVSEVLERLGGWEGHDAYVCGPTPMVAEAVGALHDLGVPPERVRCDEADVDASGLGLTTPERAIAS
ncbi:globin domain-containing protein [Thermomonospora umbrina]|uniref:nitric oxide dioxygenase n=1 Tax=Thermomonospora umbrina TaxID=111806 RepID=A0A3D9T4J4_9ACTN|nr:globin domain-containing protein [Thermomonospora umbrina]REF00166.1 NAD(P)H-flavin reductase [Thermomonospora umbrina]